VIVLATVFEKLIIFVQKTIHILAKLHRKLLPPPTKATLFDSNVYQIFCWLGHCTRPHWEDYSAPPDPLDAFRGPNSEEGEGEAREGAPRDP